MWNSHKIILEVVATVWNQKGYEQSGKSIIVMKILMEPRVAQRWMFGLEWLEWVIEKEKLATDIPLRDQKFTIEMKMIWETRDESTKIQKHLHLAADRMVSLYSEKGNDEIWIT